MGLPQRHNPIFSSHHCRAAALPLGLPSASPPLRCASPPPALRPAHLPAFRQLHLQLHSPAAMAACPTSSIQKALAKGQASTGAPLSVSLTAPAFSGSQPQPPAPRHALQSSQPSANAHGSHLTSHEDGTDDDPAEDLDAIFEDVQPRRASSSAKLSPASKAKPSSKHSTPKVEAGKSKPKAKAKVELLDDEDELPAVQAKPKRKAPALAAPDAKKARPSDDLAVSASLQAAHVATQSAAALGKAIQDLLSSTSAGVKATNEAQAALWSSMLADHRQAMQAIPQQIAEQCKAAVTQMAEARAEHIAKMKSFYVKAMHQMQEQAAGE